MKTICSLVCLALVFLVTGICAAEAPDLLGNWTGSWDAYDEGAGFSSSENGSITLTFTEQQGRIFAGNITYRLNNQTGTEGFAGAIGPDDKSIYIAEFEKGYSLGTLISEDVMELIYLLDGETASVAIDRLYREKQ